VPNGAAARRRGCQEPHLPATSDNAGATIDDADAGSVSPSAFALFIESGHCAVWHPRRSASAPFGIRAVRHPRN
jgi:hypothetical protein